MRKSGGLARQADCRPIFICAPEWRDLAGKASYKRSEPATRAGQIYDGPELMWRLIKFLILLAILAGVALVAYAYVGPIFFPDDFAAPGTERNLPVTLGED
ncbi:hypothetical protein EU805_06870 [Salipiger sp. IMCC34102]|uniref:hypothetical protein n=1 Tax=Salipiger sp. IMCC34102 TaxID=2510647 RepID=UPI00101CD9F3|nr:hypothetical protein [Salipiger sp. IMCC34102]RYH03437.1 hypothetical protein EU805_06870 [Salipiger sp. IMCC34102]